MQINKGRVRENILVFKTDIDTIQKLNYVNYLLRAMPKINFWSVDQKDIDKVLRVRASEELSGSDLCNLLKKIKIHCEELE